MAGISELLSTLPTLHVITTTKSVDVNFCVCLVFNVLSGQLTVSLIVGIECSCDA